MTGTRTTSLTTKIVQDDDDDEVGNRQSRKKKTQRPPGRWRIYLVEKRDKEVSHCWKNLQILMYVVVIIGGIFCSKSMGDVVFMFGNRCVWNATLVTTFYDNGTRVISFDNFDLVRWGDLSDCYFCQFFPVASMAAGGFLATFFAMCGRGGDTTRKGQCNMGGTGLAVSSLILPQPWRMVPIAFFFNTIFVIISFVHVTYIYNGFMLFCKNIHPINEKSIPESCEELFTAMVANSYSKDSLSTNIGGAKVFSVIGLVGWILGLVVLMARCCTHADFQVKAERLVPVLPPTTAAKAEERDYLFESSSIEYSTPMTSINFN